MNHIQEWRQDAVVEEVAAEVEQNMETAAKVVEVDARKNLLRISDPEWGAAYRKMLALYRLTSFVTRQGLMIEAGIGIPGGKKGSDYGFWIEIGSHTAKAHPWLRPALLNNLRNLLQIITGS